MFSKIWGRGRIEAEIVRVGEGKKRGGEAMQNLNWADDTPQRTALGSVGEKSEAKSVKKFLPSSLDCIIMQKKIVV